jgi:hypothetical protein
MCEIRFVGLDGSDVESSQYDFNRQFTLATPSLYRINIFAAMLALELFGSQKRAGNPQFVAYDEICLAVKHLATHDTLVKIQQGIQGCNIAPKETQSALLVRAAKSLASVMNVATVTFVYTEPAKAEFYQNCDSDDAWKNEESLTTPDGIAKSMAEESLCRQKRGMLYAAGARLPYRRGQTTKATNLKKKAAAEKEKAKKGGIQPKTNSPETPNVMPSLQGLANTTSCANPPVLTDDDVNIKQLRDTYMKYLRPLPGLGIEMKQDLKDADDQDGT